MINGWVYDPKGGTAVFSTISGLSAAVKGGFERLSDGQLFLLQGNNNNQYRGGTTNRTLTWKSKKYVTPSAMSMSWLSLEATTYPTTGMVLKAYADGTLFAHYTLQKNLTAVTFAVTVVNSGGNKFAFDGGSAAPVLTLRRGVSAIDFATVGATSGGSFTSSTFTVTVPVTLFAALQFAVVQSAELGNPLSVTVTLTVLVLVLDAS